MRVYQASNDSLHTLGCDTEEYPTRDFIKAHSYRYKEPNKDVPMLAVQKGSGFCRYGLCLYAFVRIVECVMRFGLVRRINGVTFSPLFTCRSDEMERSPGPTAFWRLFYVWSDFSAPSTPLVSKSLETVRCTARYCTTVFVV